MDWENVVADVTDVMPQSNWTPGRSGCKISGITLHHNGGNLSLAGCKAVMTGRGVSAHYQVDMYGRVAQYVNDWDTAWHAGNWAANLKTIGVEHADVSSSPWSISEATLDSGAHLVAALCLHYDLGRPRWAVNVFPHSHWSATACPASLAGFQRDAYMARAQAWYDQMKSGGSAPAPSAPKPVAPQEAKPGAAVDVTYALRRLNGAWWPDVVNCNDVDGDGYAGEPGVEHDLLTVAVDRGSVRYRVSCDPQCGRWLDWVTKADKSDTADGCAGIPGKTIYGVQVYYETPAGETYQQAWYRSQTTERAGYLGVCCDDGTSWVGYDGWAGLPGEPLDRLQIRIAPSCPF